MKRAVSLYLFFAIIYNLCCINISGAESENTVSEGMVQLLTAIDVLESGFDKWEDNATRGFVADTVIKMLNQHNSAQYHPVFSDVTEAAEYGASITYAADLGFINAYDHGKFFPTADAVYSEIIKIVVSALGYSEIAAVKGGYPSGYTMIANELKISSGGYSLNSKMKNKDFLEMIYKAVSVKCIEIVSLGNYGAEYSKGTTILEKYHDTFAVNGIVTEAAGTAIDFRKTTSRNDEIIIGDYLCRSSVEFPLDYLGKRISAYVKESEEVTVPVLLGIKTIESAREYIVLAEDIEGVLESGGARTFGYSAGGDKIKEINIPKDAMYYYNGRVCTDLKLISNSFLMTEGNIRILDSESGWYVFINEYRNIVVGNIDKINFILKDAYGNGNLDLYQDKLDKYFKIIKGGNTIAFSDIAVGNIVSVFASSDNSFIIAYVSDKKIEGIIDETYVDDDIPLYRIGENSYKLSSSLEKAMTANKTAFTELKLNDKGTFYLDYFDKIAEYQVIRSDFYYAYMIGFMLDEKTVDKTLKLHIYDPAKGGLIVVDAASRLIINGVQYKNSVDAYNNILARNSERMLVKVKYNSSNEVTAIELSVDMLLNPRPQGAPIEKERLRYEYEANDAKVYSKRIAGKYILDENTRIFYVPATGEELRTESLGLFNDYASRTFDVFDCDELNVAGALVIKVDTSVNAKNEEIYYGNSVYIVSRIGSGEVKVPGEYGKIITGWELNKLVKLYSSTEEIINVDKDINTKAGSNYNIPLKNIGDGQGAARHGHWGYGYLEYDDIKAGDLIQVEYDLKQAVNRFRILLRLTELNGYFDILYDGLQAEPYSMLSYGRVTYMNKRGLILNYEGGERVYTLAPTAPVLIYNRLNGNVTVGSWADVSEGSEIIIRAIKFGIRQIIVINN